MSKAENNNKRKRSKSSELTAVIFEIILIVVLIYFYFLFLEYGINPVLVTLIILFILLLFAGPFLRGKQNKRLYSKMFPDKNNRSKNKMPDFKQRDEVKLYTPQKKILKNINLDYNFKKPLLNKCTKCGMILTNFVKKCPICNTPVEGH